ncbi:MAG: DNA sulfur modification protein DndB [Planctomycetes bacterium]|nr:DNA sulfur modification protein DndB [Planctomycetota bacterium]
MQNSYTFTAIRGVQAGRDYYVAMCPATMVPKILDFEDGRNDDKIGIRKLNAVAIPKISEYLCDNPTEYVLSSITVAIGGEFAFEPFDSDVSGDHGLLIIPMTTPLLVNDGQHRCAGIREALKKRPELSEESVSLLFFVDEKFERSKQMFADLNRR